MFKTKEEFDTYLDSDLTEDPDMLAEIESASGIDYHFDEEGKLSEVVVVEPDKGDEEAECSASF